MRIVLVEDNEALARGIENALRDQGHGVNHIANGTEAFDFLAREGADLAIIDINLPGMTGLEIIRGLRRRGSDLPMMILTARGMTTDKVAGLDAGADDYLVKPFEMAELNARVRALVRRRAVMHRQEETLGALRFDRAARQLSGPDGVIDLPRRELALFELLLDHVGHVVPKETIVDTLYGVGSEVDANAVELLVSRLRRKLPSEGVVIRTARGLGYLLQEAPN